MKPQLNEEVHTSMLLDSPEVGGVDPMLESYYTGIGEDGKGSLEELKGLIDLYGILGQSSKIGVSIYHILVLKVVLLKCISACSPKRYRHLYHPKIIGSPRNSGLIVHPLLLLLHL
jgi:hypothetical protein